VRPSAAIDRRRSASACSVRIASASDSGILQYYTAAAGRAEFPIVHCNAPWVSAVLEPDGNLRPCFFHPAYGSASGGLDEVLNAPSAIAFRQSLSVERDETCRRCVCSLNLPLTRSVSRPW
jgi:MoaA/NifB/PqqE/SkfB family radical SAM enzyme